VRGREEERKRGREEERKRGREEEKKRGREEERKNDIFTFYVMSNYLQHNIIFIKS